MSDFVGQTYKMMPYKNTDLNQYQAMMKVVAANRLPFYFSVVKLSGMKAEAFNNLTLADRASLLAEFGSYLISIEHYDYRIHLFSLNDGFAEIYENVETRQIQRITVASYKDLDKYLSRIVIGRLTRFNRL